MGQILRRSIVLIALAFLITGLGSVGRAVAETKDLFDVSLPEASRAFAINTQSLPRATGGATAWTSPEVVAEDARWVKPYVALSPAAVAALVSLDVVATEPGTGGAERVVFSRTAPSEDGERDTIAFPPVHQPRFRVRATFRDGPPAGELQIEIARLLVLRPFGSSQLPAVSLGGAKASLAPTADERLQRLFAKVAQRQSVTRGAGWSRVTPDASPPVPDVVLAHALSVARLRRKAPACEHARLSTRESREHADTATVGCTAFRVGPDLMATAWHCMPDEGNGGCKTARVEFGYDNASEASGETRVAVERCREVLYRSSRLDFVIFRVEGKQRPKWDAAPVLRFVTGKGMLPFQDEPLAVLHYPTSTPECRGQVRERTDDVQVGLRASFWSATSRGGRCKVLGKGIGGAGKRFALDPPRDPKDACQERGAPNRTLALGHGCATCTGSSGSPVISLATDPERRGRVVGVHVNGADPDAEDEFPNRAVRSHAIADCIDLEALHERAAVVAAESAPRHDHCACSPGDVCPGATAAAPAAATAPRR